MTYDLRGRVALVTGGARGIGHGTAQALLARGAQVAIADLDQATVEAAAQALGPDVLGLQADVTSAERMVAVVAEVVERFGKLDVVVANAGIAPLPASLRALDPAEFEKVVEVDLLGVYRTVHPALEHVIANQGHVVVVSSIYAFTNGMGAAPYAVAKAGVEQLGRLLRTELSIHGASATVAYFGFIDTEMVHETFDRHPFGDDVKAALPKPLQKRLKPAEAGEGIAGAIEKRAARLILPRRWTALSVLRGIINPIVDEASARHKPVQALLRKLDA